MKKRIVSVFTATLLTGAFIGSFAISHAANVGRGSLRVTPGQTASSTPPAPDCPQCKVPGCSACLSDNCDLDRNRGEFTIPDPTVDVSQGYPEGLACIDFDGDGPAHCCKVEVQPEWILRHATAADRQDPGTEFYNGLVKDGECSHTYCAGGVPTEIECNYFDTEGDSELGGKNHVYTHGRPPHH